MESHDARWTLAAAELQRLAPAAIGRWLVATGGRLWLTQTGGGAAREADVWLRPGQRQWLPAGSEWLIEGADAAASGFVLLEPPPARSARPASPAAPRAASRPGFPWLRPGLSSS